MVIFEQQRLQQLAGLIGEGESSLSQIPKGPPCPGQKCDARPTIPGVFGWKCTGRCQDTTRLYSSEFPKPTKIQQPVSQEIGEPLSVAMARDDAAVAPP